jgi:hypothetical protein
MVEAWDDTEVARRWLMICPQRKCGGKALEPTEAELNSIRNCPVKLAETRERLSSVSWWIRLLNQRIAQRANRETDEVGRFWQDRFRSIRIEDEESLLACAAYVDLNPIRAAMAETIEGSEYTSVKRRIDAELLSTDSESSHPVTEPKIPTKVRRDAFLAKLSIDEANDPIGVVPSETGRRCSDKGFLSMDFTAYLELLDWTARQLVPGKRGSTPEDTPPILKRLGLLPTSWIELVSDFEDTFCHLAGRCDRIDAARSHQTQRRFRGPPRARKLLPSPA